MGEHKPQETYRSQVECQSHPLFLNLRQPAHHLHSVLVHSADYLNLRDENPYMICNARLTTLAMCSCFFGLTLYPLDAHAQPTVTWRWSHTTEESESIETILKQLNQPVPSLQGKRPLGEVLRMLPMPIRVDAVALEEESLTLDEVIESDSYSPQTIRMYLETILNPLQLTWRPEVGFVTITSRQGSANTLCIYDITSYIQYSGNSKREYTEAGARFESLSHVIQSSISPDQWTQAGGNSELLAWKTQNSIRMVVVAPYETQFAIQALFATEAKLTADATRHSRAPNVQSNQVAKSSTVRHSRLKRF